MAHKFEPAVKCPAEATLVAGAHLNDLLYVIYFSHESNISVDTKLANLPNNAFSNRFAIF